MMQSDVRNQLQQDLSEVSRIHDPVLGYVADLALAPASPSNPLWDRIDLVATRGQNGKLRSTEYLYHRADGSVAPVAIMWDYRCEERPEARIYYGICTMHACDDGAYPVMEKFLKSDRSIRMEGFMDTYMRGMNSGDLGLITSAWNENFEIRLPTTHRNSPMRYEDAKLVYASELNSMKSCDDYFTFCNIIRDGNSIVLEFNIGATSPISCGMARYELSNTDQKIESITDYY